MAPLSHSDILEHHYRMCEACKAWNASRVVFGDRLSRSSAAFYCDHCYHALHYIAIPSKERDGEGNQIEYKLLYDDFSVFPYVRDA